MNKATAIVDRLLESDAKDWIMRQPLQPVKGVTNPMERVVYSIGVGDHYVAFDFHVYDDGSIQLDSEIDDNLVRRTSKLRVVRVHAADAVAEAKIMVGAARRYLADLGVSAEASAKAVKRAERRDGYAPSKLQFIDEGDAFITDITRNVNKILKARENS